MDIYFFADVELKKKINIRNVNNEILIYNIYNYIIYIIYYELEVRKIGGVSKNYRTIEP